MTDRAASPVIGVILMVALVVILAGVVGSFTISIAGNAGTPVPQVSFSIGWDEQERTLTITHRAGDAFTRDNTQRLEVVIYDDDETGQNDFDVARKDWVNQTNGGYRVQAGDNFVITGESGGGDLDVEQVGTNVANPGSETHEPEVDDVVQVIWYGPDDRSRTLEEHVITSGED